MARSNERQHAVAGPVRCAAAVSLALALGAWGARAQTLLFSGPGASAGSGSGSRTVVQIAGRYYVFFYDGAQVVFTSSLDGVSFCPPAPASNGRAASLGFSVAAYGGAKIGLAYGNFDAGSAQYSFRYDEAAVPAPAPGCPSLSFASTLLPDSPSPDLRGFQPAVIFSSAGLPFVSAIDLSHSYNGSLTGCGAIKTHYRPAPYYFDGTTWRYLGYCYNWATAQNPSSVAVAALGNGNVVPAAVVYNTTAVSTAVLNPTLPQLTTELTEPWQIVTNANATTVASHLSAAQSVGTTTDVHYVYVTRSPNTVFYARQQAGNPTKTDTAVDQTTISPSGTSPVISRPGSASGCYSIAWIDAGNTIKRAAFSGSITSRGTTTSAFTRTVTPSNLSAELDAAVAPALTWQEGSSIYFGILQGGAPPALTASPSPAPADGVSTVSVTSTPFLDSCGSPVAPGTPITVTSSLGTIVDADVDSTRPGVQVAASSSGTIGFTVRAPAAAGVATISAMPAAGGPSASTSVSFNAVPTQIVFTTAAQSVPAGNCSGIATLETQGPLSTPVGVAAPTTIDLSGASASFYSDLACATPITGVPFPAGASSGSFYFKSSAQGPLLLTASASGLASATQTETITTAPVNKLAFTSAPKSLIAGTCSGAVTVQAQDLGGSPITVGSDTPLALSSSSAGNSFFSDTACSVAGTVKILSGQSTASLSFKDSQAGTPTLVASAPSFNSAQQTQNVAAASPPVKVAIASAPVSAIAGGCSGAITVQSEDGFGNPSPVTAPLQVSLASASPSLAFSTSASCSPSASSAQIASGMSSAVFYFTDTRAGAVAVTVDATAAGMGTDTQGETVFPQPPAQLVFTTPPRLSYAGDCSLPLTVQALDPFGNPSAPAASTALIFSGLSSAGLYSDGGCAAPLGAPSLGPGADSATFYFRDLVAETFTLFTAAGSLAGASQLESVAAGPPVRIAIASAPVTAIAGACSGAVTVQPFDAYGNATAVGSPVAAALSSTSSTLTFSADPSCSASASSVQIAAGASSAVFHFTDTRAGAAGVTVDATAAGLGTDTQGETIVPGAPDHVRATASPASTLVAHDVAVSFQVEDAYANAVPAALPISPAASGAPCAFASSPLTSDATGAAATTLNCSGAGAVQICATSAGLTGAPVCADVAVAPRPPDHVALSASPQAPVATPAAVALRLLDDLGNEVAQALGVELAVSDPGRFCGSSLAPSSALAGVTLTGSLDALGHGQVEVCSDVPGVVAVSARFAGQAAAAASASIEFGLPVEITLELQASAAAPEPGSPVRVVAVLTNRSAQPLKDPRLHVVIDGLALGAGSVAGTALQLDADQVRFILPAMPAGSTVTAQIEGYLGAAKGAQATARGVAEDALGHKLGESAPAALVAGALTMSFGCGCQSAPGSSVFYGFAIAWLLARRRRRRTSAAAGGDPAG